MKPHVLITGAAGYLCTALWETRRSPDDDVQELHKGYGTLGRAPRKNV